MGFLVLGGEPIVPTGSFAVPYPWGLRMDGLSLWYIRRHGWMELGFEEGYFRSLLEGMGWSVSFKSNRALPLMDVWMARRLEGDSAYSKPSNNDVLAIWEAKDRKLCTQVGKLAADSRAIESTGAPGYLVYGPYVQLEGGFYEVQWHGRTGATLATGQADVACDGGQTILSVADFSISANAVAKPNQVIAHARFSVTHAITDVEFRMRIDAGAHLGIERVILRKL